METYMLVNGKMILEMDKEFKNIKKEIWIIIIGEKNKHINLLGEYMKDNGKMIKCMVMEF